MKIDNVQIPKTSFLGMEKDLSIIVNKVLSNQRLKKLLFYTDKDCLSRPNLTEEESLSLFGRQIKIVPKISIDDNVQNYLVITFNEFQRNDTNPEFRDSVISFDIICHFDQWQIKDFQLRPFLMAAELDSMLDKKKLTGIGTLEFVGASQQNVNDEFGGLTLIYKAIHGGEDQKFMLNPNDDEQFIKDFMERVKNE